MTSILCLYMSACAALMRYPPLIASFFGVIDDDNVHPDK